MLYVCWCDGSPSCHGSTEIPFGLCDECAELGHRRLPKMDLTADDVKREDWIP